MSDASDFIIENGVLKKYVGPGGDVVIPEGVTEIGENAFCYYESLQELEYSIPNKTLTGVSLPNHLSKIGESAFDNCVLLTKVNFPEGLKEIGSKAFRGTSLTEIHIPKSVKKIGDDAFGFLGAWQVIEGEVRIKAVEEREPCVVKIDGTPKFGKTVFKCDYKVEDFCDGKLCAQFDVKDNVPLFPLVLSWAELTTEARIRLVLQMLRRTGNFRRADLEYLTALIKRGQKALFPELMKQLGAEEMCVFLELGLMNAENADTVLELLRDKPEERAIALDFAAKNITMDQRAAAEEKIINREIEKKQKRNIAIEEALRLFEQKKPAEIKKEWGTSEGESGLRIEKYKGKDVNIVVPAVLGKAQAAEIAEDSMRAAAGESGAKNAYQKKMYKNKCVVIQDGIRKIGARAFKGCVFLTDAVVPASVTEIGQDAFEDCHNLTIHAPAGSVAEQYAKENGIPFVAE